MAQSDGQNYAIQDENAGQVKNQQKSPQSSISSQNDINKDAQVVSVEIHHPIQTSTEGQHNAIHNENLGQVENQQELSQPSIYSQNDMNKDAAVVSVEMQLPIQNPTDRQNDVVHNENVGQVENQQELAQSSVHNENVGQVENQQELAQSSVHSENVGRVENQQELAQSSTNAQNDINKDAAALSVDMQHTIQNVDRDSSPSHLNDQFNGSDLLEENVSAQIQQSVGDKTDIVMGVSKVISQEPVPLCKADTEGEIVVSIAEAQQAVVDKTDIVKGVSKVTSQEPVPLCKAHTEGEIVVSMAKVDTAVVHAEDVNLQS